jgi:hypothetical protein
MLFQDPVVAPSGRPIELGDHRPLIFDADAVNTILITVQSKKATVAPITETFHGRQNIVWLKPLVGEGSVLRIGHREIDYTVRLWSEINYQWRFWKYGWRWFERGNQNGSAGFVSRRGLH